MRREKTGGAAIILIAGVILTGCASSEPKGNPYAYTPAASPEPSTVDATLAAKVKQACVDQVNTVARNAARKIANVPPKFYKVTSASFTGDVEQAELPLTPGTCSQLPAGDNDAGHDSTGQPQRQNDPHWDRCGPGGC